jgi:formylglycine-generating enzyme required for sulfatase activity/predicted Ser/Thr protein kinase
MPSLSLSDVPGGQALQAGTQLEEFIIERVLGSGGFGITYLARDKRLGRKVVIKENLPAQFCWRNTTTLTVQPRQSIGEDVDNFQYSLENFEKEAATLASLDHPGIVKVLRSFEANGTAYFVMPFVEGITFDEVIREREALNRYFTEEELIALLHKVLDALAYLHDRGIYHRDIKPGNLLITAKGDPVLIDFGAARQRLSERSLTVIESPGYTPFEQMQSRGKVGPWSDLYALGGTVYKAITGETPAKAADRAFDEPVVPLLERPEMKGRYSQTMLRSIDHAMRPKLSERPQSAGEWVRSLTGILPPVSTKSAPAFAPTTTTKAGAPIAPLKVGTLTDRDIQKGTAVNVAMAVDGTSRKAISRSDLMWLWGGVFVIALLLVGFASQLRTKSASDPSEIMSVTTVTTPIYEPIHVVTPDKMSAFDGGEVGKSLQIEIGIGQKMAFQFCPAGSFMMGSPASEADRSDDEDQVQVKISQGFWMGQTEVSQRQWAAVMGGNPSQFKGDDLPVEQVSWEDAQAFIAKLNQSAVRPEGWKYALPTEAQWEYACRAGTKSVFGFGDVLNGREANCDGNSPYGTSTKGPYQGKTANVGSYAANAWGLYDMHGNVWEWCADWYGEKLSGGVDPVGVWTGSFRVFRGGSWRESAIACRAAFRYIRLTPGSSKGRVGLRTAAVRATAR